MIGQQIYAQELAEARAKIYQLLSTLYTKPPEEELLRFLKDWVASQTDVSSQMLSPQMRRGLALLEGFFKTWEGKSEEALEEAVSVEFTKLFRGVKLHYSPLPPYESVYRQEDGRTFGESAIAVRQEYRRFGLGLGDVLSGEPPDHISFELEFMRLLCGQEAEAWKKDDKDEALRLLQAAKEFVAEHLLTWLPQLCYQIREYASLDLFRGLVDLTEGWVTFDFQQHLLSTSGVFGN